MYVYRAPGLHSTVAVVCCLFSHLLVVLDDAELYEKGQPLPLHHIRALVKGLKRPLFAFCWEQVRDRTNSTDRQLVLHEIEIRNPRVLSFCGRFKGTFLCLLV